MARVKKGFSGLSVSDIIERARKIKNMMTGNAAFATPNPSLADVGDAIDALETAYNESRNRDKEKINTMRLRKRDLLNLMDLLASYVNEASGHDSEVILSSGFDVAAAKTTHADVAGVVDNLRLSDGSTIGGILVEWDKAANSVIYVLETSLSADFSNNDFAGCTTKTHKEIGSFASGVRVYVRVYALGRENPGPRSIVVSILMR